MARVPFVNDPVSMPYNAVAAMPSAAEPAVAEPVPPPRPDDRRFHQLKTLIGKCVADWGSLARMYAEPYLKTATWLTPEQVVEIDTLLDSAL